MIYQLKITLKHMKPTVWRRIQIDCQTSFIILHHLIQDAFDWDDSHLHEFSLRFKDSNESASSSPRNLRIGSTADVGSIDAMLNEEEETIGDHLKNPKDKALYTYDFGDDWEHEILLEHIMYPKEDILYPRCLKAKGLAPEEDSVGNWENEDPPAQSIDEATLVHDINRMFARFAVEPARFSEEITERDNWLELFQVIDEYKNLQPWQYFGDNQIIGVVLPDTGETVYCSILGNIGEEYGLSVHLGNDGLKGIRHIFENPFTFNQNDMMRQHSIVLWLSDRDELEQEDYNLIKSLDLSFRGKKQWPMLRSIQPGYHPWFLNQMEMQNLTIALKQVIEVTKQFKGTPEELPFYEETEWLMRIPFKKGQEITWENERKTAQLLEEKQEPATLLISEVEMKRIKKGFHSVNVVVEFDVRYFLEAVQEIEGERPYFPNLVLAADPTEGTMIFADIFGHETYAYDLQSMFLVFIEKLGGIPEELQMESDETYHILEPLLSALSIHVTKVDQLPALSYFYKMLGEDRMMF